MPTTAPQTPIRCLAGAALAYGTAVTAINLTAWTSPTPLNAGTYGELGGALTARSGLKAAGAAAITWYAATAGANRHGAAPDTR